MISSSMVHVIDDDSAAGTSLAFLLGTAEFVVKAYESAKAFLDAVPSTQTGCVITDVRMPEIDGIELFDVLRGQGIALPVIVITGHGDVPLAVEAIKAGAADFIEKPYEGELLLEAVRSALSVQGADAKQEAERTEIRRRMADLSPRERQVVDGLVAGQPEQDHRLRPRRQRPDGGDLSRQPHDEDAGEKPFPSRAHGVDIGLLRASSAPEPIEDRY